uniref:ComEC/Rec2 family competence protein n=1 Tax=Roseihalotalea indica TaxID=2867963 RepID=A0AA49GHS2_9BACT|nr:ComEC/Rec2 family competence protein [Tunicatimonas sp. TK19036]
MFRWVPYPFLRITPLLLLGVGIAKWVRIEWAVMLLAIAFLIFSVLRFFIGNRTFSKYHFWVGSVAALCILFLGIIRTHQHDSSHNPTHFIHHNDTIDYYIATVTDHPEPKKNSYQVELNVEYVFLNKKDQGLSCTGKVLAYQPKADSSELMEFGDQILIKGAPSIVSLPKNPAEFDYQQYLTYQNIYHQHYLPASDWVLIQADVYPSWLGISGIWRNRCRDILLHYIKDAKAQGIALAITLGLKSHLDREVQEAYAATGAMHVLAVSGLHVGIIYVIISFLFGRLQQVPKVGRTLYIIICLTGLWTYALVTGLSPSVQRAAVMFSFIIISATIKRQSNIYNTLACSAFVLLWADPFILYSVGFQLSYLAVFGIVYMQPRIYAWFTPSTKIVDWAWQLTSVSIAAQIATFPLGIYYFHQFPIYFWISNIVVIPGALIMLPSGLATLLTGFVAPPLAKVCGWLLETVIQLVNTLVSLIQQIPGSTIERVSITPAQTWLLYLAVVFLLLLLHYRKLRYLALAVASLFSVVTMQTAKMYQQYQEMSITIYSVKEDTHLDFTQGFTNLHVGSWTSSAQYHILPNHIQKGVHTEFVSDTISHPTLLYTSEQEVEMMRWQGKTMVIIREPLYRNKPAQPIRVDYVIVAHNAIRELAHLNNFFSYNQLIIDGTNSYYTAQKLANEAAHKHIAYHSVPVQGAITIPWKP